MIERVNPSHPDKVADRIAGAIVDVAYKSQKSPKIAVEILIGHGECYYTIETSVEIPEKTIEDIIHRIAGKGITKITGKQVAQDPILFENQKGKYLRCGDNGIFTGRPLTHEEFKLQLLAGLFYDKWPTDGKYILDEERNRLIICQSNTEAREIRNFVNNRHLHSLVEGLDIVINPLGFWTGGLDVDSGATNRKLGSDMGHSVSGGGLHGKDMSKADVAINIWAFREAQKMDYPIDISCAIGDESIDLTDARHEEKIPYQSIVNNSLRYVMDELGGFEKLAEWGLF